MINLHLEDEVASGFVAALRQAISGELDRTKQIAKLSEIRSQMIEVLRAAPYRADMAKEAELRADLCKALDDAINIVSEGKDITPAYFTATGQALSQQ
ncbi:hypothetical protein [Roseomonas sp. WA12]